MNYELRITNYDDLTFSFQFSVFNLIRFDVSTIKRLDNKTVKRNNE